MSIGKNSLARAAAAAGTKVPAPAAEQTSVIPEGYCQVAVDSIRPVKGEKLPAAVAEDLIRSVSEQGVLEPLLLAQTGAAQLQLLSGSRRLCAAKAAGLPTVPAVIREMTAAQAAAARRELQRFAAAPDQKMTSTPASAATAVGQAMPDWLL